MSTHSIESDLNVNGDLDVTGTTNYCAWIEGGSANQLMTGSNVKLNNTFWGTPLINESKSFISFEADKFRINLSGFYSIVVTIFYRQGDGTSESRLIESQLNKNTNTLLSFGADVMPDVSASFDSLNSMNYTYAGVLDDGDTFHVTIRSIDSTAGNCFRCRLLVTRM